MGWYSSANLSENARIRERMQVLGLRSETPWNSSPSRMHSLNALLLALVITDRMDLGSIRRNRQQTGRKSDVSLTTRYMRDKNAERRARCRQLCICVDCGDSSGKFTRCIECRKIRNSQRR